MRQTTRFSELFYTASIAVDIRWFYSTIAFLFALISVTGSTQQTLVFSLFAGHLLSNFVFYLFLDDIVRARRSTIYLDAVNGLQIVFDFVYITLMVLLAGESFLSIAYILYFIPIILALLYFSFATTVLIALLNSITIFLLKIYSFSLQTELSPFVEVTVITVMYLLTSFFGASIMKSIRTRENLLSEKMHKEEDHIRRLSILADEFDKSAKLLVRRDLDLTKAHHELERIDQMKSEIISIVAHQLRTPLSAVKWTLKMLTDGDSGPVSAEQKTMMMKAYESNERMIGLVNDMLSADRMESGKFRYRFFPIQLEDLIENVVTEILPRANDRGVSVRFLRPAQNLPRVTIDPEKIREVLQNLIDNAIKYSRRGGTVTIGTQREAGMLLCSISDQGIGIPKSEQEKIFGRFFRAQNALRVETDGSGLGLFIVRGIIQRHGGTIGFESEEGKGTTMRIRLPLDPLSRIK